MPITTGVILEKITPVFYIFRFLFTKSPIITVDIGRKSGDNFE